MSLFRRARSNEKILIWRAAALQNFMSRHCRKARLNTNHYHLDLHSHLEIGRIFDQSLQNALLRQSAKMKCKNDGPLRRSAKMKCKSDGLPGGADFITPQRVCQVLFRALVELGRFGLVC